MLIQAKHVALQLLAEDPDLAVVRDLHSDSVVQVLRDLSSLFQVDIFIQSDD